MTKLFFILLGCAILFVLWVACEDDGEAGQ